jgi:peptidyl-prolyl cis-trans isomerase A (cyclophilin A)
MRQLLGHSVVVKTSVVCLIVTALLPRFDIAQSLDLSRPDTYRTRFATTKGDFVVEIHREWAPLAAERFHALVTNGFYDDAAFFRVVPNFMAQFGIPSSPTVGAAWAHANLRDEPVKQGNTRGRITFAMAGPNTRTTQVFINFRDNSNLDSQGFAAFGEVIEGMDVVDTIYGGYGDMQEMGGHGPSPGKIASEGNAYLDTYFPQLDRIKTAVVVTAPSPSDTEAHKCLRYSPTAIALTGTVASHQGLQSWWGLKLDTPICTVADNSDPYMIAYQDVRETQIIVFQNEDLTPYSGQRITISGELLPMVNGHHQTRVMIGLKSVQVAGRNANVPQRKAQARPTYLPDAFHASVTVLAKPIARVTAQAWDRDPNAFLAESDAYVTHMFNGPMDVMWVSCLAGYRIADAKSTTASAVFPMDADNPKNAYWGVAVSDSKRTNITIGCVRATK